MYIGKVALPSLDNWATFRTQPSTTVVPGYFCTRSNRDMNQAYYTN